MEQLRVHLFGRIRISFGDHPVQLQGSNKLQQLLCYLLLYRGRSHSRELIAALLWGDRTTAQARQCLRTCLWRLNKALCPQDIHNSPFLVSENDELGFNCESDYWLDVQEFEMHMAHWTALSDTSRGLQPSISTRELDRCLALYQGDLMEGCFEDWCMIERERLHNLFLKGLFALMRHQHEHNLYQDAIETGQCILSHDPLLEEVHRELMQLHLSAGNRVAAIRQFHQCRLLLLKELGVEPMPETLSLYREMGLDADADSGRSVAESAGTGSARPDKTVQRQVDQALSRIQLTMSQVHTLGEHLQESARELESIREKLGGI